MMELSLPRNLPLSGYLPLPGHLLFFRKALKVPVCQFVYLLPVLVMVLFHLFIMLRMRMPVFTVFGVCICYKSKR